MRRWWLVCTVMFSSLVGVAANAQLVEGTDYQVISPAQPTDRPDKIVVTEFFSYECPHCFEFFPLVSSWAAKLPSDVVFERIPVSFGRPAWASIGQAYYSLQAMGKLDPKLDKAIFDAIHVQNIRLIDLPSITDWLATQGINAKDFTDMYNSFGIKMDMDRAEKAVPAYGVDGVPTLVVDGKYKVLGADHSKQLQIADQLIARVRAARGMPAPKMTSTTSGTDAKQKATATKSASRKKVAHHQS